MKNVIKLLAKIVLIPLGLTATVSAGDAGIHKKILGSGTTTLMILTDEMKDKIKTVKYLEDSGLLLIGVSETFKVKLKNKKEDFFVCY